jgi:hypothetical protein
MKPVPSPATKCRGGNKQRRAKTLAKLLKVIGVIWAVIGAGNIIGMFAKVGSGHERLETFGMIFTFVLFIIPGLLLAGLGVVIPKNKQHTPVAQWRCPYCQTTYEQIRNFCTACSQKSDPIARMVATPGVRP